MPSYLNYLIVSDIFQLNQKPRHNRFIQSDSLVILADQTYHQPILFNRVCAKCAYNDGSRGKSVLNLRVNIVHNIINLRYASIELGRSGFNIRSISGPSGSMYVHTLRLYLGVCPY